MSVLLLIVGPKCTLAASHAVPLVSHGLYADGTDRQTDGRQTVTLRLPLYAARVVNQEYRFCFAILASIQSVLYCNKSSLFHLLSVA